MGLIGWLVRLVVRLLLLFVLASMAWAWSLRRAASPTPDPAADEIELVGSFGGQQFRSTAAAFRGGRLVAAYGGGLLDLRAATLDPAGARLRLEALLGGFQIVVPETWRVDLQVVGILGGTGDARDASKVAPDGPLLTIEGFAVLGGAGVTSSRRDAAAAMEFMAEA
jgi:hypothetical protein